MSTEDHVQTTTAPTPEATPRTDIDKLPTWFATTASGVYVEVVDMSLVRAALAAKDREIENLVWNLAGCDTLAMGYSKPGEFSKELARPGLYSVSKLRAERDQLRERVDELDLDKMRLDWLETNHHWLLCAETESPTFSCGSNENFQNWALKVATVRMAIDAARKKGAT